MKFASRDTAEKLADEFGLLPPDEFTQSWELCTVELDPQRLQKLIEGCSSSALSDEEQRTLMTVVLNSMDHMCKSHESPAPEGWQRVVQIVKEKPSDYHYLVERWASLDVDPEDRFYLSPHIVRAFPELLSNARSKRDEVDE